MQVKNQNIQKLYVQQQNQDSQVLQKQILQCNGNQRFYEIILKNDESHQIIQFSIQDFPLKSQYLICFLKSPKKYINPCIIKELNLNYNQICDNGIKQLCRNQYQQNKLEKLLLSSNKVTMRGMLYLSRAAENKLFPQLKQLYLINNLIENNNNSKNVTQIEEGLLLKFANDNTKLKTLNLMRNKINSKDMDQLFKYKKNQKIYVFEHLQVFHLGCNKINSGMKYLIMRSCINSNNNTNLNLFQKLQRLYLVSSDLTSQTIKVLVSRKYSLNNLKILNLSKNIIGDEGIKHFFKGCKQGGFTSLQEINFSYTKLSNNGIQCIIKQYDPNKSLIALKCIWLKYNALAASDKAINKKLQKRFSFDVKFLIEPND